MHQALFRAVFGVDEGAALFLEENWVSIKDFNTKATDLGAAFVWSEELILGQGFWANLSQEIYNAKVRAKGRLMEDETTTKIRVD